MKTHGVPPRVAAATMFTRTLARAPQAVVACRRIDALVKLSPFESPCKGHRTEYTKLSLNLEQGPVACREWRGGLLGGGPCNSARPTARWSLELRSGCVLTHSLGGTPAKRLHLSDCWWAYLQRLNGRFCRGHLCQTSQLHACIVHRHSPKCSGTLCPGTSADNMCLQTGIFSEVHHFQRMQMLQ
jgi:hypothetical protein